MSINLADPQDQQHRNIKTLTYLVGVALVMLVLIGRLAWLQIADYDKNLRLSESNRIRKVVVKAERGYIYDRFGTLMVRNRPSYQIALLPHELKDRDSVFQRLLRITDTTGKRLIDSAHLDWTFQRGRWQKFRPLRLLEDASDYEVAFIEERASEFPGIVTIVESRRDYPYGTFASHVFGYTGEISEKQLEDSVYIKESYTYGDRIGQKGLEKEYDADFRGRNGIKYIEVNAYGKEIGLISEMEHVDAIQGNSMVTTIDFELQKVAEDAFPDSIKGGLVVIDPRNGEILAMVSSPRLDPNIFSLEKRNLAKKWASVALDSAQPLNNRAIMGTYPPASVFKFYTAVAALENHHIDEHSKYAVACNGGFRFGSRYQRCWSNRHGKMNVVDALRESCDVFFYQCGLDVDMDKINAVARKYGLGTRMGVDIPGEKNGLLMDSSTYNKRFKRLGWRWSRGQVLNLAIGQGQLVTPLQTAAAFGALASNRGLYRPHLMKEIKDPTGKVVKKYKPVKIQDATISEETHRIVLKAMQEVIEGEHATGRAAKVEGIRVGGKTGSAENPQGTKTHAWFATTAPLDNPEIAIGLVMENAGGGGAMAAPIAGKILRRFFLGDSLNPPARLKYQEKP